MNVIQCVRSTHWATLEAWRRTSHIHRKKTKKKFKLQFANTQKINKRWKVNEIIKRTNEKKPASLIDNISVGEKRSARIRWKGRDSPEEYSNYVRGVDTVELMFVCLFVWTLVDLSRLSNGFSSEISLTGETRHRNHESISEPAQKRTVRFQERTRERMMKNSNRRLLNANSEMINECGDKILYTEHKLYEHYTGERERERENAWDWQVSSVSKWKSRLEAIHSINYHFLVAARAHSDSVRQEEWEKNPFYSVFV